MTRNEVIAILGEPSEYQELESPERNTRDLIYRSMFDEDPCVYMYYYAHYSFDENDELIGFLLYDGKPRKWQHWEPYFKAMDPPHLVKFPM